VNFKSIVFIALLPAVIMGCSAQKEQAKEQPIDTVAVQKAPPEIPVYKDSVLDYKGRFIAGLEQFDSNSYTKLQDDAFWKKYRTSVDTSWSKMYKSRLIKMKEWQTSTFSTVVKDTMTLFYPFSGPDFLHAYYLYPETNEFLLFALEPIIQIASLDSVGTKERDKFLDSLNHSLRDIFYKSYFITTHMQKDLKQVKGVLPPLYFFIERTGHELLEQKFVTLDSLGEEKNSYGWKIVSSACAGCETYLPQRGDAANQDTVLL